MAVSYMTEEGYNKILAEINYLETVKRPEISAQIAEARDKGDLSENAEYDAAKEAQNLKEGKIAISTPIAQGLLGKKVGDIVEIKVPSGIMNFEIMDISI